MKFIVKGVARPWQLNINVMHEMWCNKHYLQVR